MSAASALLPENLFSYSGFNEKTCFGIQFLRNGVELHQNNDENGLTICLEKNIICAFDRSLNFFSVVKEYYKLLVTLENNAWTFCRCSWPYVFWLIMTRSFSASATRLSFHEAEKKQLS